MTIRDELDRAYFDACRELIRSGQTAGLADMASMFPILTSLRGVMSARDQFDLLSLINEERDDDKAFALYTNGNGPLRGFNDMFGLGLATITEMHGRRMAGEPTEAPSPGSIAKPAFDLGMVYAYAQRVPLDDPTDIAHHAAVHAQNIAVDVPLQSATLSAAAMMYTRGYGIVGRIDVTPQDADRAGKYLKNLDKAIAKREGRSGSFSFFRR